MNDIPRISLDGYSYLKSLLNLEVMFIGKSPSRNVSTGKLKQPNILVNQEACLGDFVLPRDQLAVEFSFPKWNTVQAISQHWTFLEMF